MPHPWNNSYTCTHRKLFYQEGPSMQVVVPSQSFLFRSSLWSQSLDGPHCPALQSRHTHLFLFRQPAYQSTLTASSHPGSALYHPLPSTAWIHHQKHTKKSCHTIPDYSPCGHTQRQKQCCSDPLRQDHLQKSGQQQPHRQHLPKAPHCFSWDTSQDTIKLWPSASSNGLTANLTLRRGRIFHWTHKYPAHLYW